MHTLRLYKIEKLCSETAIDRLFRRDDPAVSSALAYPLRASWRRNDTRTPSTAQFLISVPKKRIRLAVGRVLMRRRIREAYRLNRHLLPPDSRLDIAFIYVAAEQLPYARIQAAMRRLLAKIAEQSQAQ